MRRSILRRSFRQPPEAKLRVGIQCSHGVEQRSTSGPRSPPAAGVDSPASGGRGPGPKGAQACSQRLRHQVPCPGHTYSWSGGLGSVADGGRTRCAAGNDRPARRRRSERKHRPPGRRDQAAEREYRVLLALMTVL